MSDTMTVQEQDTRLRLLNSFMSCPHRETDKILQLHAELQQSDPLFYAHLACWYRKNGELRDHNEVFTAMLSCDEYTPNREVGLALYRDQAPFMKSRILGFIKGKKVKIRKKTGKKISRGRGRSKKDHDEVQIEEKTVGIFKNPPTSLKKEVTAFLRFLESNPEKFDAVCVRGSKDLKALYASLRIKPSDRANNILFKKEYPEDSRMSVFEEITKASTPEKAAKLIVQHKIPFTTAVGLVSKITPSILVALINAMSPQEIINNIASLQEKGALDNEDTKKLIEGKLEKAKTSKNVSTLKSKTAKKTGRVTNESVLKKLDEVADEQVKKSAQISIPTAVFVDRSGSMSRAIEVGKGVAALISGATMADLYVVAFDSAAMPVIPTSKKPTYTDWEVAFKPVRPGGSTSMGCALDYLLRKKQYVEQIVIITDEGENAHPKFKDVYRKYAEAMKVEPHVVLINIDRDYGVSRFRLDLNSIDCQFDVYTPSGGDYYGLPGLIPLLSRKSKLDLVYEIMEYPLASRRAFK